DLFIPEEGVNGAFNRDIVAVRLSGPKQGKRQEAEVTQVISRGTTSLVGIYQHAGNYGFVIPDNEKFASDIFVPKERSKGAVTGHKVVVELTDYGDLSKNPEGRVVEILGHVNDPGVDILSIVKGFELPLGFSEKVINQAKRVAKDVSDKDREGRKDLRNVTMVTIDGEDAKDLDDAVSLSKEGDHYLLGVHIADVTNYVQENSALDHEALERGTSVYLVDRVIPMLPHALSNGICSLNMGEDRLALSCLMTLDQKGTVISYEIAETVINVDRRMSYTDVNRVLTGDEEAVKAYEDLAPMFLLMKELADLVREKRRSRGSIDFDFPESKILLDEDGTPVSIKPYERN
ncbi:MAG: ribonuclease R, partial [Lachnospiraceae bacterium]|nr:ribonuclease R [Lachnospiraceae bacterium]